VSKRIPERRWIKFFPAEYETAPELRMCSLAAQGLWMRLLCRMHDGVPSGHLTIKGRAPTIAEIGAIIGHDQDVVEPLIEELRVNGVFSETSAGVIFSRRLVRDAKAYAAAVRSGRKGGNPKIIKETPSKNKNNGVKGRVNGTLSSPVNPALNLEVESETESYLSVQSAACVAGANKRGTRLPNNWRPSDADREYAAALGLDVPRVTDDFRSYWLAKAGKDAVKVDWSLTWQGWCRRAADWRGPQQKPEEKKTGFLL
jgi:hypothetical protein